MYLTGNYERTLDAKLRLTLPAQWKGDLTGDGGDRGTEPSSTLCLIPMPDAIYGFTPEAHRSWVDSRFPGGFDPTDKKMDRLRRYLAQSTLTVDVDKAGRVCLGKLGEEKLARLGIQKEVEVIGNIDHFEIWNREKFQVEMEEIYDEELSQLLFSM